MNKYSRNVEGYADNTAGMATGRVLREERKVAMARKRNCRRTADENVIHEKAVKMRKMTDVQLVCYVESREEKARKEGLAQGKKEAPLPVISLEEIMKELASVRGIGAVKMKQIRIILENGLGGYAK